MYENKNDQYTHNFLAARVHECQPPALSDVRLSVENEVTESKQAV